MFAAASVGFGPPPGPHWAAGLLGCGDVCMRGCPFNDRVGGALFRCWRCDANRRLRQPETEALLWPCRPETRARPPRGLVVASGCLSGCQLTLLPRVCARKAEQLRSRFPLQRGETITWRKQAVKGDVAINHRCRGHESFSDFDSWGHRSQLSSAAGLVWADSSRDGGAPAACNGGAPQLAG